LLFLAEEAPVLIRDIAKATADDLDVSRILAASREGAEVTQGAHDRPPTAR
jgi:hypothetical protein